MNCTCVQWEPNDTSVRQCPEHYHIWRGAKRLASVGSIIRGSFPLDPSIPPDVLANACDRGSQVDALFAQYCRGALHCIPAGTRQDVFKEMPPYDGLLQKLMKWFDKQNFKKVEVHVLLGGEDHGGVLDFRFDGVPVDLKCTYNVEETARLQVAGYFTLSGSLQQRRSTDAFVLHATERLHEAKLVPTIAKDVEDWNILLAHWRMVQRRTKQ